MLNLFAYTGGATVACASGRGLLCAMWTRPRVWWPGARRTPVSPAWSEAPIRWIVDDCAKFVEREIRRGKTYDAIIMDPPSYGRGPGGEVWKLEDNLYPFVELCSRVLSDKPAVRGIEQLYHGAWRRRCWGTYCRLLVGRKFGGTVTWDELGLPCTESGMALPCGATGRWFSE